MMGEDGKKKLARKWVREWVDVDEERGLRLLQWRRVTEEELAEAEKKKAESMGAAAPAASGGEAMETE